MNLPWCMIALSLVGAAGQEPAKPQRPGVVPLPIDFQISQPTGQRYGCPKVPVDAARTSARGLRGEARTQLVARLAELDIEVMQIARTSLGPAVQAELERQADDQLGVFRDQMAPDRYARTRDTAVIRLIRERLALPTIAFE